MLAKGLPRAWPREETNAWHRAYHGLPVIVRLTALEASWRGARRLSLQILMTLFDGEKQHRLCAIRHV